MRTRQSRLRDAETVETVLSICRIRITGLKPGVNEIRRFRVRQPRSFDVEREGLRHKRTNSQLTPVRHHTNGPFLAGGQHLRAARAPALNHLFVRMSEH